MWQPNWPMEPSVPVLSRAHRGSSASVIRTVARGSSMPEDNNGVDELNYVWDEYKYRHELCWQAIYKLAASAVVLGVLPYPNAKLTQVLGDWMLVPPVLATLLIAFGVFVVNNELRLFAKIKVA